MIAEFRRVGRATAYLDETWINQHHQLDRAWCDDEEQEEFPEAPSGEGKRLILLYAGTKEGWVPECKLLFVGRKNTRDNHDEMNAQHFDEW